MRKLLVIAAAAVLGGVGLLLWLRPARVNTWEIRNLAAVRDGPVLCFGDSLVEGIGASSPAASYPAMLGRELGCRVDARGVSGMTVSEGLAELRENPLVEGGLVVVTLGGNDILRQVPLAETREALRGLFAELQARGCGVAYTEVLGILSGSRARMHREVCRECGVILIPDVLDGILGDDNLLADSIHPNDAGYALMAQRVAAVLRKYRQR